MTRLVALVFVLGGASALADDAPRLADVSSARLVPDVAPPVQYGSLFAATSAFGFTASVTGVLVGAGFGALSNNLFGALLPGALLGNLLLPPLITALSAVLVGNVDGVRFTAWWPLLGAFVANAAVYLLTSLVLPIAVSFANPGTLLLYALVDGLVMAGATTGVMALTEQKPVSTVRSFAPGVTDTTFVALSTVQL